MKIYKFITRTLNILKRAFVYIEVMYAVYKLEPGDPRTLLVEGVIPSFFGLNYNKDAGDPEQWIDDIRAVFGFIF